MRDENAPQTADLLEMTTEIVASYVSGNEISVEGLTVKDVGILKEKVYTLMEQKLIFYKASWIKK